MGEEEKGTSFKDTVTGILYNYDNYGKALIRFCEPINISDYVKKYSEEKGIELETLRTDVKAKK